MKWLQILYKPKSVLGLLVAVGLLFLLIGGLSIEIYPSVSVFFETWGKRILFIGIIAWLLYMLPSIIRNWGKLLGR